MLRFFRKMRQALVPENRFGRYFFYAIGEIVLVVIGILIALQINKWNEEKKAKTLEYEFLQQMQLDLKADVKWFNREIGRLDKAILSLEYISIAILSDSEYSETLARNFSSALGPPLAALKTSTFESIQSLGIQRIKNVELRNSIMNLYSGVYKAVYRVTDMFTQEYMLTMNPLQHKYLVITPPNTNKPGNNTPRNFEELKRNHEFYNTVNDQMKLNMAIRRINQNALLGAKKLLEDIEVELNKSN